MRPHLSMSVVSSIPVHTSDYSAAVRCSQKQVEKDLKEAYSFRGEGLRQASGSQGREDT